MTPISRAKLTNSEFLHRISGRGITPLEPYINSKTKILVRCDVDSNEWSVSPGSLLKGCGCPECRNTKLRNERTKSPQVFISELYGRLITVLDPYVNRHTRIRFKCDTCDNIWTTSPGSILGGSGCPKCAIDKVVKDLSIIREIVGDHGSWVEIDVSTKSHPGAIMKIDRPIRDKLIEDVVHGCYATQGKNDTLYCNCTLNKKDNRLHRLIVPGRVIDHKNHNGLDNRIQNLRACSHSQNNMNSVLRKNNSSGVTGVGWRSDKNKWEVRISVDGKVVRLGYFDDLETATAARKEAEVIYHKEFSYDSSKKKGTY